MKTFLKILGVLMLVFILSCIAVGLGLCIVGFSSPHFGLHINGSPGPLAAPFGLGVAALSVVFALVVTAVALAGAFIAVLFAFLVTGLVLLACALPFLLPFIIPLALIFIVVLVSRRSGRAKTA